MGIAGGVSRRVAENLPRRDLASGGIQAALGDLVAMRSMNWLVSCATLTASYPVGCHTNDAAQASLPVRYLHKP